MRTRPEIVSVLRRLAWWNSVEPPRGPKFLAARIFPARPECLEARIAMDGGSLTFPAPFVAVGPDGAVAYSASHADALAGGEVDSFTLALEAGQSLTLLVEPSTGLQPKIQLASTGVAKTASATAAGQTLLLQSGVAAVSGEYTFSISGLGSTAGAYTVRAVLNAALELEASAGISNNSITNAEPLSEHFLELGNGASRAVVLGRLPGTEGVPVFSESFESGVLPANWSTYSSNTGGRVRVSTAEGAADGAYALLMDTSSYQGTLNEAIWTVNLAGVPKPGLTFSHHGFFDERNSFSGPFSGHYLADGVAISGDGATWYPVWSAPAQPNTWQSYHFDLTTAASDAGINLGESLKIKFQQFGYAPLESDGRGWDKIALTTPDSSEDWYRFSLNEGESLSFVADSLAGSGLKLEIKNAAGVSLAEGISGVANTDQVVQDFVAPTTGELFLKVSGTIGGDYTLLVTRGAAFDAGQNGSATAAQALGLTGNVLGAVDQTSMGRLFAYDSSGDLVREVDPKSGVVLRSFALPFGLEGASGRLGMATSQTTLLVGGAAGSAIYELNPDTGATLRTIANPSGEVTGMAFLNNEVFLLSSTPANRITVLDYATGAVKRTITTSIGFYDHLAASETELYSTSGTSVYRIDPVSGATTVAGTSGLLGYYQGLGMLGDELFGGSYSSIGVFALNPLAPARSLTELDYVTALGADGGASDTDFFRFSASVGSTLVLRTTTPPSGTGATHNTVDPIIELFDPAGVLIASDDNGAPDGRNASLSLVASSTGNYTVRVRAVAKTSGEYLLSVAGALAPEPAFQVSSVVPTDGSRFATAPATFRLDFNDALTLTSVQASDLTINGVPAAAVSVIDGDTLEFTVADPGPGTHTVAVAAGALTDVQATPIAAFSTTITVDDIAPRVVSTSIQENAVLPPGALTVVIGFSEPMKTAGVNGSDLTLRGDLRGKSYTPASVVFDASGTQLTVKYQDLFEDQYILTLLSKDGSFEDLVGRNLDGELSASPLPPNQSGDGTEGGDFVARFTVDGSTAPMPALRPLEPLGSRVHEGVFTAAIATAGDVDTYTIQLGVGSRLTLYADADATLHPKLSLRDPANVIVGSVIASAPGEDIALQTITATEAGTYTLTVDGVGQTHGLAAIRAVLNAVIEPEAQNATSNNSPQTAVNLDTLLLPLPGGGATVSVRGGIENVAPMLPAEAEPNGSTASANAAVANFVAAPGNLFHQTLRATRSTGSDVDFFSIGSLDAGDVISIAQYGQGSGRGILNDGSFTLYRSSTGTPVVVLSDQNSGASNDALKYGYTVAETDTYYVAVSGFTGSTGSYDLSLWLENTGEAPGKGGAFLAETEGNDTIATANDASKNWRQVQYVSRTSAEISSANDGDFYRFEFQAGDLVTVNLDSTSTVDLRSSLRNASGIEVAREDGSSTGPGTDSPIYAFRIPASGAYYLFAGATAGSGAYEANVYLSTTTPPPAPGTPEDFYSVTLAAGERASFAVNSIGGSTIKLELQDGNGALLAVGAVGPDGNARIENFTPAEAGRYYARITGNLGSSYNLLTLRGADLDGVSNNTLSTAQPIGDSGIVVGRAGLSSAPGRVFAYDSVANYIREINPHTGEILRSFRSPADELQTGELALATTNNSLLVGGSRLSPIYELDPDTGATIRTFPNPGDTNGMAFLDGTIYVSTSSFGSSPQLRAVDYVTGAQRSAPSISNTSNGILNGGLAAGNGVLFAIDSSDRLCEIDPTSGAVSTVGFLSGVGIAKGLGVSGNEVFVADGSSIQVFDLLSLSRSRSFTGFSGMTAIGGDNSVARDVDYYQLHATAGATLTIKTATSVAANPQTTFDPFVVLYDASGKVVASDNNSASDGINASLSYKAPESGVYTVYVRGFSSFAGDYVLTVEGADAATNDFAVASITPAPESVLGSAPGTIRINFDGALLLSSLAAGDFAIDGVPAESITLVDGDSVEITVPAGLGHGTHQISIASGALTSIAGVSLEAYSAAFSVDLQAPRVISTNVQQGDVLTPGAVTFTIGFNELMKTSGIDSSDVTLVNATTGGSYSPSKIAFNAAGDTLTVYYPRLSDGSYQLTLLSQSSSFVDRVGRTLDGESPSWPIPGNQSGDGVAGGNFTVDFSVDSGTARPFSPFTPVGPLGAQVYAASEKYGISSATDVDEFTVSVAPGQSLTLIARPQGALRPAVAIIDANGNSVVNTAASKPGGEGFVHLPPTSFGGAYTVRLSGADGSMGFATLDAFLNVSRELEQRENTSNDYIAGAESIDGLFTTLSNGVRIARVGGIIDRTGGPLATESEPNNAPGQASSAEGTFVGVESNLFQLLARGTRDATSDVDYFNIGTLDAGDILTISQSGLDSLRGTLGVPFVTLYRGSTGSPVHVFSDSRDGAGNDALIAKYTLPATDTYFIAASGTGGVGTYELGLWLENKGSSPLTGGTQVAEVEGNGTAATANDISTSWRAVQYESHVTGVSKHGDPDIYSYQFAAGDLVTINLDPGSSAALQLSLLDESGAVLVKADEGVFSLAHNTPIFGFQIPATGTYFLKAETPYLYSAGGYTASVYLSSGTLPPALQPTDDFYAITLAAGERVAFAVMAAGDRAVELTLQDGSATPIAIGKKNQWDSGSAIQQFTAPEAGTYYVRVAGEVGATYQFAALRGAEWGLEGNDSIELAQNFAGDGTVVGYTGHSVMNGLFIYGSTPPVIKQLDRETGAVIRSFPAPGSYSGSDFGLATTGRTLLASGGPLKLLYELNPETGDVLRSIAIPEDYTAGLGFSGNEIFVLTSSPSGQIAVLDYETGALKRTIVAAGITDGLTSTDGALLGINSSGVLFEINPLTGATTERSTLGGYSDGLGIIGSELFVGGSSEVRVFHYPSMELLRTLRNSNYSTAVGADGGGSILGDFFGINAVAGAVLTVTTATPGSAALNGLDPVLDLYDATGTLITTNDNGATDGRNAMLSLTVPADGKYYVQVRATNGTRGEYVLHVDGASEAVHPFNVARVNPANGTKFATAPTAVRVDFDRLVDSRSLQAGDLNIGGFPAASVRLIDGDSAEFAVPSGLKGGVHTLTLSAGAVTDLAGVPLTEFSSQFEIDVTPPTIVGVSLQDGATAPSGTLVYVVEFSEPMRTVNLDEDDFSLRRQNLPGVSYSNAETSYDDTGKFLTLTWTNLPDDVYTLTLRSGEGFFQNEAGLFLDGEHSELTPRVFPTGNNVPGGDFVTQFTLDGAAPVTLMPKKLGTVASPLTLANASTVLTPGDSDTYTVALSAGESLTTSVNPDPTLTAGVIIRDSQGNVVAEIQGTTVDQTVNIPAFIAPATGVYSITISALDGTSGLAALTIVGNGALETEGSGGVANDTLATAQDINGSFLHVIDNSRQVSVLGSTGGSDWYRFEMEAGETLSFAIDNSGFLPSSSARALELTDASGTVLLSAEAGFYFNRAAHGFTAPFTGTYYLHVEGLSSGSYQLVAGVNLNIHDSIITSVGQGLGVATTAIGTLRTLGDVFAYNAQINRIINLSLTSFPTVQFTAPTSSNSGNDLGLASTGSTLLSSARGSSSIKEFDPATGDLLREIPAPGLSPSGLAYNDGEIFALRDSRLGEIVVLDYQTGLVKRTIFADVPLDKNLAAASDHLVAMRGDTFYQIDPQTGLTATLGKVALPTLYSSSGSSAAKVNGLGVSDGKLYVGYGTSGSASSGFDTSVIRIYDLSTLKLLASPYLYDARAVGAISGDSQEPVPHLFTVQAPEAGSTLLVSALTPGGDRNTLSPRIELLDAAGLVVASDSASDGHDATLSYTAAAAGTFTVRLSAVAGAGDYLLRVLGANTSNDAPMLSTSGVPTLANLLEDQAIIPGTRIADLLGVNTGDPAVVDLDANALFGIALTSTDTTHGSWEYSHDGNTWTTVGNVSDSSALLLDAEALLRFVPVPGFNGTADISYRAWDQTTGTHGETADATLHGGSTAFSADAEVATITVLPTDDAPDIVPPGAQVTRENVPLTFSSASGDGIVLIDPDGGSPGVQVSISTVHGTLTLGTAAGLTFTTGDGTADGSMVFAGDVAAINAALDGLVFTPAAEFAGDAEISVALYDSGRSTSEPPASSIIIPVKVTPVIEFTDSATFTDADGDLVKVVLRGGGQGEIWLADSGESNAIAIVLDGTTARSTLTIVTPRGAETIIGDLLVNGSLKSLSAATADLAGTFDVAGTLGSAVLDDVTGSVIRLHSNAELPLTKKSAVSLKFDRVSDTSLTSDGIHLASIRATEWLDTDQSRERLGVPSLGKFQVSGSGKQLLEGNLGADLSVAGTVKTIQVTGDVSGNIAAHSIGSLQVKGSLTNAEIILTAAVESENSSLIALGALKIRGVMSASVLESVGRIGAITVGGMRDSRVFAGVASDSTELPDSAADFVASASIGKFSVLGSTPEFSNSLLAAASIGRLSLKGVDTENGGIAFGIAADRIAALVLQHGGGTFRQQKLVNPEQSFNEDDLLVRVV